MLKPPNTRVGPQKEDEWSREVVLDLDPSDKSSRERSLAPLKPAWKEVEAEMKTKGLTGDSTWGIFLVYDDFMANVANHCRPCQARVKTTVAQDSARTEVEWEQDVRFDFQASLAARQQELMPLSGPSLEEEAESRRERSESEGKIGGIGQGLILLDHFTDVEQAPTEHPRYKIVFTAPKKGKAQG
ncbi:MAG: hypothetical protein GF416_03410 [Candidatus Altiarchaeales archaeon]|nr:hypothetical protein [Candidatus Altiarchaeales archaeon]MBD3416167.1 hypothetical protein [Candidatus Altiarchaeales archaeon]